MPRGKHILNVKVLGGDQLMKVQEAAKLAGIHPAILEMGQRLVAGIAPGTSRSKEGGVFELGTPELKAKAAELGRVFVAGLKRVAKALGPKLPDGQSYAVRSYRDGDRLVFWYAAGFGGKKPKPK